MIKFLAVLIVCILMIPAGMYLYLYSVLIPPAREAVVGILPVPDRVDYWQSPAETRERGAGDCEDFTALIAEKYDQLGIPFSVCIIEEPQGEHMLLMVGAYYVDSVWPKLIKIKDHNQPIYTMTYKEFKLYL